MKATSHPRLQTTAGRLKKADQYNTYTHQVASHGTKADPPPHPAVPLGIATYESQGVREGTAGGSSRIPQAGPQGYCEYDCVPRSHFGSSPHLQVPSATTISVGTLPEAPIPHQRDEGAQNSQHFSIDSPWNSCTPFACRRVAGSQGCPGP